MQTNPTPHPPLRWGILATGRIAAQFATDLRASPTGALQAVASRNLARAQSFVAEHATPTHAPTAHGDYAALLADPDVDVVYIANPHPGHCEWAIRAAEAGKAILCEKPIGMTHAEATRITDAARRHGVFLMEAFKQRCHPQTHRIVEIVRSGRLGTVRFIEATFGFRTKFDPANRLWNAELGGGSILDVGCYPCAMTRLLAGAAAGQPFAEPLAIAASAVPCPETGVDSRAAATLTFPDGLLAQIACAIDVPLANSVTIHGTEGRLHVPDPWTIPLQSRLALTDFNPNRTEEIITTTDRPLFAHEADTVAESIHAGALESPAMPLADSLGNAALLDRWLAAI